VTNKQRDFESVEVTTCETTMEHTTTVVKQEEVMDREQRGGTTTPSCFAKDEEATGHLNESLTAVTTRL